MKHYLVVTLLTIFGTGLQLHSAASGDYQVRAVSVFESEDEQVWQITIETTKPAQYRVVQRGSHGGVGELFGSTSATRRRTRVCQEKLWLVVSQITPSTGDSTYIKTILKGTGALISRTRQTAKGVELSRPFSEPLTGAAQKQPMNTWIIIGEVDGEKIRLIVGDKSVEAAAEPASAASQNQPLSLGTNQTSTETGSGR